MDIENYLDTGVNPVLCHMFGINTYGDEIYEVPKENPADEPDNFEIDFGDESEGIDDNEEFELDINPDEQDTDSEAFRISQMLKDN